MKVYFACPVVGNRPAQDVYERIVTALLAAGHEVPTSILAKPEVTKLDEVADPVEIYTNAIRWIDECHCLVAEVSTPAHGVGYEIAYALGQGKPVLCCYRQGANVSKMITGNQSPGLEVGSYQEAEEAVQIVISFVRKITYMS